MNLPLVKVGFKIFEVMMIQMIDLLIIHTDNEKLSQELLNKRGIYYQFI